jgi:hypothetical protein
MPIAAVLPSPCGSGDEPITQLQVTYDATERVQAHWDSRASLTLTREPTSTLIAVYDASRGFFAQFV